MEKVIITLRGADADDTWCARMRAQVAADLLDLDLPGLAINVRDDVVRDSLMTLTTLDPPVVGFVSLWTQQSYGDQVAAAIARLEKECDDVAAYLVTESVPLPPPDTVPGQRTAGLANVALLRRPDDLDEATWLTALAHRPHAGGDRNAVDVRVHPERCGAPADAGSAGSSPRSSRSSSPKRRYPICMRSSAPPMTTTCATGWSAWWPAPPRSARIAMSTRCRRAAMSFERRSWSTTLAVR